MRVFVSSTFTDLIEYREAVTRAILAAGDIPDDMLYWPAEENRPLDVCMRRLKASDLLILILAHRYGFIPPGNDKSVTEIEFDTAISSGKPVLAFCLDENHPWPPPFLERDEAIFSRLRNFHKKVKGTLTIRHFTTPESLEAGVSQAVSNYRSESLGRVGKGRFVLASRSVNRRECLLYAPSSLVMIGQAPDGAPLLLDVEREIDLSPTIDAIAKRIGKSRNDEYISKAKKEIAFHAKSFSLSRGIREVTPHRGVTSSTVYSSDIPIGRLLGANLLQTLTVQQVDSARHAVNSERSNARREGWVREGTRRSGIESRKGLDARVTSVGGANRFLFTN
jgi:hypothetical protein